MGGTCSVPRRGEAGAEGADGAPHRRMMPRRSARSPRARRRQSPRTAPPAPSWCLSPATLPQRAHHRASVAAGLRVSAGRRPSAGASGRARAVQRLVRVLGQRDARLRLAATGDRRRRHLPKIKSQRGRLRAGSVASAENCARARWGPAAARGPAARGASRSGRGPRTSSSADTRSCPLQPSRASLQHSHRTKCPALRSEPAPCRTRRPLVRRTWAYRARDP